MKAEPVLMRIVFSREYPGIGARIKDQRVASTKPLAQLASEAGISVPHWNRIENEKVQDLPLETLRGIERALGTDFGVKLGDGGSGILGMPKSLPGVNSRIPGVNSANVPGLPDRNLPSSLDSLTNSLEGTEIDRVQASMLDDDSGNTADTK